MQNRAHLSLAAVDAALLASSQQAVNPGPYLLGAHFTAADIMMGYTILISEKLAPTAPEAYPSAKKYWSMLQQRPGCAVALNDLQNGPLGKQK